MQQNMKTAKTRERMQEKLKRRNQERQATAAAQQQNIKEDLGEMKQVKEDVFVWNDENSVTTGKPKKSGKKKGKKKKN